MRTLPLLLLFAALPAHADAIALPDGAGGIGFDDLRFDPGSNRLLIPAGRTGNLDLIDPTTRTVTAISGFSKIAQYDDGHGQSVTSADAGEGHLFATDRTALQLAIVKSGQILSRAPLASTPDYVRYVAPTREVWVTQPGRKRIEVFALANGAATHKSFIDAPGGPESLVIDGKRGRAYTHQWKKSTYSIDLATHKIVATWKSGCDDPRGIALDEARGFLFIGCEDGSATVLDVAHEGRLLSQEKSAGGVDIIAYDAKRAHLYLPGEGTMAILGVSPAGVLTLLGVAPTVKDAHCVTTDGNGNAYVCDPKAGRLLVVHDSYK